MNKIKRTIILSGASGFTGRNLINFFDSNRYEILVIQRPSNFKILTAHSNIKEININDFNEVEKLLKGNVIDAVIHLATVYNRKEDVDAKKMIWDANVCLGKTLLEIAIKYNAQFIHIESYLQYQESINTEYLESKVAFSNLVDSLRELKLIPITSLVFFDSYGINDYRNKILNLLIAAKINGEKVNLTDPKNVILLTSIQDLVKSVSGAVDKKISGRYKVAGSDKYCLTDLADFIFNFPNHEEPQIIKETVYTAESFPLLETFAQTCNVTDFIKAQLFKKFENCT